MLVLGDGGGGCGVVQNRYLELYFTCTWYKYFIGLQRRQTCFQVFQAPRHTPVDAFVTFHERLKSALSTFQLPADADNLAWLKMPIKSSDLASPAFRSLQRRSLLHWRGRNRMGSSRKHELAMYIMASNLRILDPQQECKVRLFLTRNHHHVLYFFLYQPAGRVLFGLTELREAHPPSVPERHGQKVPTVP